MGIWSCFTACRAADCDILEATPPASTVTAQLTSVAAASGKLESLGCHGARTLTTVPPIHAAINKTPENEPYTPPVRDRLRPGDIWVAEATAAGSSSSDTAHAFAPRRQQQQHFQQSAGSSTDFAARRSMLMRSADISPLSTCCEEEERGQEEGGGDEGSHAARSGRLGDTRAASVELTLTDSVSRVASCMRFKRPPPMRSFSDLSGGRPSVSALGSRGAAAAVSAYGARRVAEQQQQQQPSPTFLQTSASLRSSLSGDVVSSMLLGSNGGNGCQSAADALMRDLASMRVIGRGAQCTVYQVRGQ